MTFTLSPATMDDLPAVTRLLAEAGLPLAGLEDQFPAAYVILRREGEIAGAAGLEVYGRSGLLRSVVVSPSLRGGGAGRALTLDRIEAARARSLSAVYLLTTTAAGFFPRLGFAPAAREEAPADLAASPELSGACPASAVCLSLRLSG